MPKLTVFLPCYNAEQFIDVCILSLISQTSRDFIVFAYDDNSTDSTYEHLLFWQEVDSIIQPKRPFEQRHGYIKLLNKMLFDADTEYVFRQDADDWSLPSRFTKQLDIECKNDCVLCGSQGKNLWHEKSKIITYPWEEIYVNPIASYEQPVNHLLQIQHRLIHGSMCMKLDTLHKLGGYDESLIPVEDWDLSLRAAHLGNVYVIP